MKKQSLIVTLSVVVLALLLMGSSVFGADKLVVKNSTGTNTVFDVTDAGFVSVGLASPLYNYDLSSQGVSKSSMHFSLNGTDAGGWITTVGDTNFFFSAGIVYDASLGGWIQKSSSGVGVVIGGDTPGLTIYTTNGTSVGGVAPVGAGARLRITPNGNVGIGTKTPTHLIELSGGAYSDGAVWTNASSRELKENIKELTAKEAVDTLNGLDPVKYNYKTDAGDKHVGFIAEDVPDLVATKDRKGLSPMDIVAVLTKVVQEQKKAIEEQKRTIEEEKKAMEKLSEKVADLQREVKLKGSLASAVR